MSGVHREWQDSGSGPGYMQRVASSGTYSRINDAYKAFIDHVLLCDDCEYGETLCKTAKGLRAAYVRARS